MDCGVVEHWAEPPAEDAENPLAATVRSVSWPADPLGARRDPFDFGSTPGVAFLGPPIPFTVSAARPGRTPYKPLTYPRMKCYDFAEVHYVVPRSVRPSVTGLSARGSQGQTAVVFR